MPQNTEKFSIFPSSFIVLSKVSMALIVPAIFVSSSFAFFNVSGVIFFFLLFDDQMNKVNVKINNNVDFILCQEFFNSMLIEYCIEADVLREKSIPI